MIGEPEPSYRSPSLPGTVTDDRPALVMGQGSLGTLFAALLAQAGERVQVVSSRAGEPERVALSVRGRRQARGEVTLRGDLPGEEAWVAIVASRAADALERSEQALDALAEDGAIVPVQNGLRSLDVADAIGPEHVLPTVVGFNAQMRGPRTVELTSRGGITTGALADATRPAMRRLVGALRGPIPADVSSNPRGAVWSKWCVSCAINGLAIVTGEGVGPVTRTRQGREALVSIVTECVDLAEREGVELERVAGPFAPDTLAGNASSGLGGMFRRGVTWMIGRGYDDVVPSSLDAAREGRDPELEAITGTAVELGERHDIPTPWNRSVLELGTEVIEGKRDPGLDQLGVLRTHATGARPST